MPQWMTAQEAAKKYTKPDGTVELPADIMIHWPKRTPMPEREKKGHIQGDMELRDGKLFVDGIETQETPHGIVFNRAARRAK